MSTPDYDRISRYVDGEMTAGEKQAFEQLLQQDAELKKEVELYKEVNETLKAQLHPGEEELALHNTLEEMRQKYFQTTGAKVVPFRRYRWFTAVAAAAAVIIAVIIWSPWSQPDLYRQYASLEMGAVEVRGTAADSLRRLVTKNFNDKKFAAAIPLFENLLQPDSANAYLHFYYAVALLETGKLQQSRNELQQLYNGTSLFRYDAAFYIALSYLKEKNNAACKEWLNKIPPDAGIYSKVQSLLKKLPGVN